MIKNNQVLLQNVKVTSNAIEIASLALRGLAGDTLDGAEMQDLEELVSQELHNNITEKANVI